MGRRRRGQAPAEKTRADEEPNDSKGLERSAERGPQRSVRPPGWP
jgi:hypothetical protein